MLRKSSARTATGASPPPQDAADPRTGVKRKRRSSSRGGRSDVSSTMAATTTPLANTPSETFVPATANRGARATQAARAAITGPPTEDGLAVSGLAVARAVPSTAANTASTAQATVPATAASGNAQARETQAAMTASRPAVRPTVRPAVGPTARTAARAAARTSASTTFRAAAAATTAPATTASGSVRNRETATRLAAAKAAARNTSPAPPPGNVAQPTPVRVARGPSTRGLAQSRWAQLPTPAEVCKEHPGGRWARVTGQAQCVSCNNMAHNRTFRCPSCDAAMCNACYRARQR